jgi:hypothetical protein
LGLIIRKDEHFLFLLANGDLVVQVMRVDQLNQALNCYERGDPIHVVGLRLWDCALRSLRISAEGI